jgi:wobble nucleotide-excising tRNase
MERELEAVQQSAQLKARAGLSELALPVVPVEFEALLSRTISDLSADAERRVAEHLATHEGLDYIRGETCPFCNQPLQGVDLIGAYRAYFGEAYNDLKKAISSQRNMLSTSFGDRAIADSERIIAGNEASIEFWSRYCDLCGPQLSSPQGLGCSLREMREAALLLCDLKAGTPLEVVLTDQRYLNAFAVVKALLTSATEYNIGVRSANLAIAGNKTSLEGASADQIQRDLLTLRTTKIRHSPECSKAVDEHMDEVTNKESL